MPRNTARYFVFVFCLCLCSACSMFLESEEVAGTGLENRSEIQVNADVIDDYQAPFTLDTAYIEGTELWIEVSYSGGCQQHDFMIVWPEVITMVYPPDFGVTVYHQNNGDNCEALISDTLKADLRETPVGDFDEATIAQMRITVVNGSKPEQRKSTR